MPRLSDLMAQPGRGPSANELDDPDFVCAERAAWGRALRFVGGTAPELPSPAAPDFTKLAIPALASGGIVTQPTLALVGERGPEAVVPLSQYGRGGAMYVTIEYHDHTMQGTDRARLAEFARDLRPELERLVTTSW